MSDFVVGEAVEVWILQKWRPATVVWVGRLRLRAEYATPRGMKRTRCSMFKKAGVRRVTPSEASK